MCANQFKHIELIQLSSLEMDATHIISKTDPDNQMTVPVPTGEVCTCEDGEPNATRDSPTLDLLVSDPQ